jgi:hypothetical protein
MHIHNILFLITAIKIDKLSYYPRLNICSAGLNKTQDVKMYLSPDVGTLPR